MTTSRIKFRLCLAALFCGLLALAPSCTSLKGEESPAKKIFAPGEIRANDIEYIAMCEAGLREGTEANYRSSSVLDRNGLYYVYLVARPYKTGMQRTVVVNDQGEVVAYVKGSKSPSSIDLGAPLPPVEPRTEEAQSSSVSTSPSP